MILNLPQSFCGTAKFLVFSMADPTCVVLRSLHERVASVVFIILLSIYKALNVSSLYTVFACILCVNLFL